MSHFRLKVKVLALLFLFLISFSVIVSNCAATFEPLKIQKIALLNPSSSQKSTNGAIDFINLYFQKYAEARPQATLITFDNSQRQPVALQDLKNNGYDLAVIPTLQNRLFGEAYSLDVYSLSPIHKLWSLSNTLDSDLELLFWILDRSLIAGIKIVPDQIRLGLVPGKDGDLGLDFPCSSIYYPLKQLPGIKIKAISLKRFNNSPTQINKLAKKLKLNYLLFYQSEELHLSKPLVTGTIFQADGAVHDQLAMRIESNQLSVITDNPNRSNYVQHSEYRLDPGQAKRDLGESRTISVASNYLSSVAEETANYFLAVLLTEFCHPQPAPLKLKLTERRKYINGKNALVPPLDNTKPSEYMIRIDIN